MLSDKYHRLPLADITILREKRQRRLIETKGLIDSIRERGVLNPIIITKDNVLVAGERRYAASLELGIPDIPVRYLEDSTPQELQVIELEENSKRTDLPWQDSCLAVSKLHGLFSTADVDWSQVKTAEALGMKESWLSSLLRLGREMENPHVHDAPTATGAYNYLVRQDERRAGDVLSDVLEAGRYMFHAPAPAPLAPTEAPPAPLPPDDYSILEASFLTWAPLYEGRPFNLLHCDFPYGANLTGGKWGTRGKEGAYADQPDDYWALLGCLCTHLDRLMAHSGHLIFWFSMRFYTETLEFFHQHAPSLDVQPMPLMWHKSDNVGIVPDPRGRGPRQTYETAFLISREDRLLVRPVANSYSAPTDKAHHPSAKPEPVLRHFFQMVVDDNTRMLDPTAGGGSAIRAAESLGAEFVLGLEIDPLHVTNARSATRHFRALRRARP